MPSDSEIDEMTRLCASHCLESLDVRGCVRGYISRLVAIRGWAQPDAELVARQALSVIARITGNQSLLENGTG